MLYAAKAGKYDVQVWFHSNNMTGEAILEIGDQTLKTAFSPDRNEVLFQGIEIARGNLNLHVT